MKRSAWSACIAIMLCACERSPYPGYSLVGDDVHLHLHTIGDGEVLPADSDSVRLRIRLGGHGELVGGLFSTEQDYLVKDIRTGALDAVIRRMHVGDSLSVIAKAVDWPWTVLATGADVLPPDTGHVQAELSVMSLRSPAMLRAERERMKRNDPLGYERRLIHAFIAQDARSFTRWGTSDIHYFINGTTTDTTACEQGDQVTISYTGRRLEDRQVFDDTERNGAPLTFTYGDKDQVMNGIEVALTLLREGQEGVFIFPSSFAFGEKGIPGILEPFMPVVYSVRLDHLERKSR